MSDNTQLHPFRVEIPQVELDDLARRLAGTRWPDRETVADSSQGAQLTKVKALVEYWRSQYDWRRLEARLNGYPQFKTEIDGLGIHFLHIQSPHADALPLIMTHGWPGSIVEFLDSIDPLVNPTAHGGAAKDAFHVVLPSIPGYGFSDKPTAKGWNRTRIAHAWHELMNRLGYPRYVAQGGDWGSVVTTEMGRLRLDGLAAIHVNLPFVVPQDLPAELSAQEQAALDQCGLFAADGIAYHDLQTTRPQTIGFSLADSPVGQAAWIYEKLVSWSHSDGKAEGVFSNDQILDNITLYWLTNSGASSARMYAEHPGLNFGAVPLELPVAVSVFPGEIYTPPKEWAEQAYSNLIYWNRVSKGGHFAAFEQPALFVAEVRAAFSSLR
ncbi:epoxide hydrolase [Pseudomonas gingeri NCPPB 3146 = LMG 5327]|uniref:Alpha/beta fold hydrolase n=2 Tax=Pseudomonas gingeri TaxID=117681 RepID=A0A7Y7XVF2_9PSED|nr:epoxide hydrolase [Pseudomonas gingeri]NVZ29365.1 alpha/beta fold hydrolase [Pseudomonas gingeri]NWC12691.1 alpha/beta fold hydrolase [Pseudomonas gingeri]NWE49842.1 alpha/beta fold hydrolase [Pseudomonas gingeri]PNQ92974.1 epoxide hydrolase [Pseudomonas gingeri NCPPB 3146 = LMG 5327]